MSGNNYLCRVCAFSGGRLCAPVTYIILSKLLMHSRRRTRGTAATGSLNRAAIKGRGRRRPARKKRKEFNSTRGSRLCSGRNYTLRY
jgi:hypothetical protein